MNLAYYLNYLNDLLFHRIQIAVLNLDLYFNLIIQVQLDFYLNNYLMDSIFIPIALLMLLLISFLIIEMLIQ